MFKILLFDNGKVSDTEIPNTKKTIWIDCSSPTSDDISDISKLTGVPVHYITECIDEDERPRSVDFDDVSVIVFKAPHTHRKETYITTCTFIIKPGLLVSLHKQDIDAINNLRKKKERLKDVEKNGTGYLLFLVIDEFITHFQRIMEDIEDQISKIEKGFFSNSQKDQSHLIFKIKKILIYFHKTFATNKEVITHIEKGYAKGIAKKNRAIFRDIYNDLIELIDLEGIYSNILTGCLEIHVSTISNNLNEIMRRLTVITAFLLFPTLIAGIYGMNFRIMPELDWKYGYLLSIGLMILSVVVMFTYFRKKKWI